MKVSKLNPVLFSKLNYRFIVCIGIVIEKNLMITYHCLTDQISNLQKDTDDKVAGRN